MKNFSQKLQDLQRDLGSIDPANPSNLITSKRAFQSRRKFIQQVALAGASAPLLGWANEAQQDGAEAKSESEGKVNNPDSALFPAKRSEDYNPGWIQTKPNVAKTYNNFYEFTTQKTQVKDLSKNFPTSPWPIEIGGLVENPMTIDAQELAQMFPLEERVYRFRCVEAWSMIVPWTGFPLSMLLNKVQPKPEAKFVRFETFNLPKLAPGIQKYGYYPWPYVEGLRLDEAMCPLSLLTFGIYGEPLPTQNGAPVRMVVPWKYGYKSIKSIVKIELVSEQPKTFWEALQPEEYPFESNVDPAKPHPRWSQAQEKLILDIESGFFGDSLNYRTVKTLPYNGYGDQVASFYQG